MYCIKCGLEIGNAKFCTECGTAACPPAPYPMSPGVRPLKQSKKMDLVKRTRLWTIMGVVMLAFGTWRFVANIMGFILYGDYEPSIFDYPIHGNGYETALRAFRIGKVLGAFAIVFYLAVMIAGLAIVIVNYKKAKEY